jgi:uncharacterized damage-inducible protein DinB
MSASDTAEILLIHNEWATRNLIDACAKLSDEQFHKKFEMGPGSIHDTATHIIGAMRVWGDFLAGRERRPRLEGAKRTPAELLTLFNEVAADFSASARNHPLDGTITFTREGKSYALARGGVIVHATTHGMHHRAQCLNMLRHVGFTPLPPSSVVEWMRTIDNV